MNVCIISSFTCFVLPSRTVYSSRLTSLSRAFILALTEPVPCLTPNTSCQSQIATTNNTKEGEGGEYDFQALRIVEFPRSGL